MILLITVLLSLVGIILFRSKLRQRVATAPRLSLPEDSLATEGTIPSISIIIPAYNEAENIADCLTSVLQSSSLPPERLDIWLVDDQSTDDTLTIAQSVQQTTGDQRLHVLAGQSRPADSIWMGKNWACAQGAQQASGEFLLFLDADVRLKPGAIAAAAQTMIDTNADLLTCCPQVVCGCLAEWLAQPFMVGLLSAGFDFLEVNDPQSDTAFAVGQFMLFRRSAYEQLGGHRAVADQVVEDVELARRVKAQGLRMHYTLGSEIASVRMYHSLQALWEGWTKNWHLGSRRNLGLSLYSAIVVFLVGVLPWLVLLALLVKLWRGDWHELDYVTVGVTVVTIGLQYELRRVGAKLSAIPPDYWWLTGLGGILVVTIVIASIIKTETGWGWTWRGRALNLPRYSSTPLLPHEDCHPGSR